MHREGRARDDGYRNELVPGLRASSDASKLVEELAFSSGRLAALAASPPALYRQARDEAAEDIERATWTCFLIAYLSPTEDDEPFAGIRKVIAAGVCAPVDLDGVPLGPRTSHELVRGGQAPAAYCRWVHQIGSQRTAFVGDPSWSAERRFERLFERLALPGFSRAARYELLVLLGRLGLYEVRADSLHLADPRGRATEDAVMAAAKRVFGIGDPLLLERRTAALAQAAAIPIDAFDLALANWTSPTRATLGFPAETLDDQAGARARDALSL